MENYEQKYKQALERAKYLKENTDSVGAKDISYSYEYIFPELKESENERIRKELIRDIDIAMPIETAQRYIAWLEKQGEQTIWKPSKEQISTLEHFVRSIGESGYASPYDSNINLLNSLIMDLYKLERQEEQKEINLAEILKHYPKETELYSPLYGKLWLAEVDEKNETITCYKHHLEEGCTRAVLEQEDTVSFYSNGTTGLPDFNISKDCMLFLYDIEK